MTSVNVRTVLAARQARTRKEQSLQMKRVATATMFGVFTLIESGTLIASRTYDFPSFLIVLCCVCICLNVPLIVLAMRAYFSQKQREEERKALYLRRMKWMENGFRK